MVIQVTESNYTGSTVIINRYVNLDAAKLHCKEWKTAMEMYLDKMKVENYRMLFGAFWQAPIEELSNGFKWHDCFCIWEEMS